MPNALIGAATCGRCSARVPAGGGRCAACGVRLDRPAAGSAVATDDGPLLGVAPVPGGRRRAAVLVDLVLIAGAALVAGATTDLLGSGLQRAGLLATAAAAAGAAVAAAALTTALRSTGRTPGRLVSGVRTVDSLSGLPPRGIAAALGALLLGRGGTVVTADLRSGRDPQEALVRAVTAAGTEAGEAPTSVAPTRPVPVDALGARLVFDSADELLVDAPVLIGRAPEPQRGVRALHALPDLTRGVGRTHLLADWSDGLLWITDLGTPGGTTVGPEDGASRPMLPGVRTAVAPGWRLVIGGRTCTVRSLAVRGVEEVVPRG